MGWDEQILDHHSVVHLVLATLQQVTPARWCQAFYLVAVGCVMAVAAAPLEARTLLVDYGARKSNKSNSTTSSTTNGDDKSTPNNRNSGSSINSRLLSVIEALTSYGQVPHAWFSVFYAVSVACSLFWLTQYLSNGAVLRTIASRQASASTASATLEQVAVAWTMMFLQGTRRAYEHAAIMKQQSKSTMWVVHWLLGLFFYLITSVSIGIEGSGAILNSSQPSKDGIGPLMKISVAVPIFVFAWVNQYRCHAHLAGLKKYSMPAQGLFRRLVCPHYTCECLLYLSIAVAAAPAGVWCNRTLLCALIFVLVNLGVTASGTRKWYVEKFGIRPIADKWNMIPFVF
ncbi:hypothetical protein B0H66DRAFT_200977 [Apodospora peruviana]|uniref:Polyprenal reductase n=1 Tax=Apodospora peruviana TaxID=516989 RepID=A0AAE0M833_9PEZI|nr:hypothetical protein B0H66DRAFT_200977 [Apodospora peruviana]